MVPLRGCLFFNHFKKWLKNRRKSREIQFPEAKTVSDAGCWCVSFSSVLQTTHATLLTSCRAAARAPLFVCSIICAARESNERESHELFRFEPVPTARSPLSCTRRDLTASFLSPLEPFRRQQRRQQQRDLQIQLPMSVEMLSLARLVLV